MEKSRFITTCRLAPAALLFAGCAGLVAGSPRAGGRGFIAGFLSHTQAAGGYRSAWEVGMGELLP